MKPAVSTRTLPSIVWSELGALMLRALRSRFSQLRQRKIEGCLERTKALGLICLVLTTAGDAAVLTNSANSTADWAASPEAYFLTREEHRQCGSLLNDAVELIRPWRWIDDGMASNELVHRFETVRPLHLIPNTGFDKKRNLTRGLSA